MRVLGVVCVCVCSFVLLWVALICCVRACVVVKGGFLVCLCFDVVLSLEVIPGKRKHCCCRSLFVCAFLID